MMKLYPCSSRQVVQGGVPGYLGKIYMYEGTWIYRQVEQGGAWISRQDIHVGGSRISRQVVQYDEVTGYLGKLY